MDIGADDSQSERCVNPAASESARQYIAVASRRGKRDHVSGGCVSAKAPTSSLSHKLDRLFKTVHPAGRGEYTFEEVARSLQERGGPTVSATYIWQLRKGVRDNPTKKHLEALAGFFGVPPTYFFDDEQSLQIQEELDFLAAIRDASIKQLALRAQGLSPAMLRTVAEMVERAREVDGLADPSVGRSSGSPAVRHAVDADEQEQP